MENTTTLHSATLHNNVKPRLEELIKQAECLRMAVAYWTIPNDYFGDDLIELLKKKESFACVDISSPTDIGELCKLANLCKFQDEQCKPSKEKYNLYFYTKSLVWDGKNKQPNRNLLHSKVLLFDLPDNLASIWIGSHNWTDRALSGKNIETSLELLVRKGSGIYTDVEDLLEEIKRDCQQIIPDTIHEEDCEEIIPDYSHERIYKTTQKQEPSLLYLRSSFTENPEFPLSSTSFIHLILDKNKPDSKAFPTGREMVFLMENLLNGKQFLLAGEVYLSGRLRASEKRAKELQTFEGGYYCLRQDNRFTNFRLKPDNNDSDFVNTINNFHHFATFVITEDIKEIDKYNIDSQLFSKYQTPIILLNEFTQLYFNDGVWHESGFEIRDQKAIDKAVKEFLDLRSNKDEIENVYENLIETDCEEDDNSEKSIRRSIRELRDRWSFTLEEGSELDSILKVISPSEGKILIKKQLVNHTEIENKIRRISRGRISKIVKKSD